MNRNRKEMLYHQPPDQKSNRRSQPIDKTGRKIVRRRKDICPVRFIGSVEAANCRICLIRRQLQWKQRKVEKLLGKFGRVQPIIGMETPYHYRNKVQAAFALTQNKRIISGVYQSSTHRVVPVEHCMTEDQKADEIIGTIRGMMHQFKLTPYNEDTGRGFLRHVLVKRGFSSNQIMVVLVTGTPVFPSKNHFVAALREKHPEITTILMNVNPYQTSMVLGENEKVFCMVTVLLKISFADACFVFRQSHFTKSTRCRPKFFIKSNCFCRFDRKR